MEKRLQKILSEMGIASRRRAEEMIEEGRVTVNGVVAELGTKADPERDHIKVDGKLLTGGREPSVYYMFNKPRNVVSTISDPEGRPCVGDYLKSVRYRVYPVGRLDFDSEGLLLITNDGEFSHGLLHPSKKVPKTYEVKIKGLLEEDELEKIRKGIRLEDGLTAPAKVRKLKALEANSWVEITLFEGKKRQIRRMMNRLGHPVIRLIRTKVAGIGLGGLEEGALRPLTPQEVEAVKRKAGLLKEVA